MCCDVSTRKNTKNVPHISLLSKTTQCFKGAVPQNWLLSTEMKLRGKEVALSRSPGQSWKSCKVDPQPDYCAACQQLQPTFCKLEKKKKKGGWGGLMLHLHATESATKINQIRYDQWVLHTKDELGNTIGVDLFLSIFS